MAYRDTGGARFRKRKPKQPRSDGGIGPDGPRRESSPGYGELRDRGRGLRGSRQQRENPRPKHITAGPRPKPKGKPKRHSSPRRPSVADPYRSEVNALANLQYRPQERELAYQQQVEAQRGANVNDWYTQHYQRALQAAQATQAGYQAAQQQAYAQGNQNLATDQAANQQLLAQQNQQAAIRGTAVDPLLNTTMQQGAQVRQQQQTQFGNLTGNLGANAAGYGQTRALQASEQGIQAGQDVQARQRKVEQLARELAADKSAFKVKARGELEDADWKKQMEAKAFGLDVAQERFDQKDAKADNRRMSKAERRQQREAKSRMRDRRQDNRRADQSLSLAERREQRMRDQDLADDGRVNGSSGSGGKSSFTPTQVRSARKELRTAVSGGEEPSDPLMARVAANIIKHGGVSPALARKFKRQYGFTPKIKRTSWQQKAGEKGRKGAQELF